MKPLLIILPGLDGDGSLRHAFASELGPVAECELISYPSDSLHDYDSLTAWVEAALPLDRPYIVVAESFSGPIGIRLAKRKSPLMRGLVLCCSFAQSPRPAMVAAARFAVLLTHAVPLGVLKSLLFSQSTSPDTVSALRTTVMKLPTETLRGRLDAIAQDDCREALRTIDIPLHYVQARSDRLIPASTAKRLQTHNPNLQVHVLDGPHALLQSQPIECAGVIASIAAQLFH